MRAVIVSIMLAALLTQAVAVTPLPTPSIK